MDLRHVAPNYKVNDALQECQMKKKKEKKKKRGGGGQETIRMSEYHTHGE